MSRVAIICGSLEPGRDGVGDYSIGLSKALLNKGVSVNLIALRDRFVGTVSRPKDNILRLPYNIADSERISLAMNQLSAQQPDWISMQFVTWSFGWKGIMGPSSRATLSLLKTRPLHVMFHETWVKSAPEGTTSRMKRLAWAGVGELQKNSVKWFFAGARPTLVHTSNAVYRGQLADIGIAARQLPMFGSVEVTDAEDWQSLRAMVLTRAGADLGPDREKVLLVGVFGTLRLCPIGPAFKAILSAAEGRRAILLSLGEVGLGGSRILESWRGYDSRLEVLALGRCKEDELSQCFNHLDAAISMHRPELLGKSGAAAAILEHGVPIICLSWGPPPAAADIFHQLWKELILQVNPELDNFLRTRRAKHQWRGARDAAAEQLLAEMGQAVSSGHTG